jgi:hypothetical protein
MLVEFVNYVELIYQPMVGRVALGKCWVYSSLSCFLH